MKVFDSESVQRKWNSLRIVPMSDAVRRMARVTAPHESLTVEALERELNKENTLTLVDPIGSSTPWESRERHRRMLARINARNREVWANGGKPAA